MKTLKIVVLAIAAISLTGCASFAERVAKCQQSGADANTCAMIVQQQDAQFAASMNAMSQQFAQQQAAQQQADAANNIANAIRFQNVTVNRGYGW